MTVDPKDVRVGDLVCVTWANGSYHVRVVDNLYVTTDYIGVVAKQDIVKVIRPAPAALAGRIIKNVKT